MIIDKITITYYNINGDNMKCKNCLNEISNRSKYCSNKCQKEFEYKQYITKWKNGEVLGMRGDYQISMNIKRYIFEKYDNKCAQCGWGKINPYTKTLPLEIEHIDGNYKNNKEENLILLCPNCHSLTSTYKGANVQNGRKSRSKYYTKKEGKL